MLMRDNAFKIYRAIVNTPEPVKEDKKDGKEDEKKDDKEKDDEEKDDVEKKSMFTRNRDLLLGCSYFDLSHIGYFEAKVIRENIFQLKFIYNIIIYINVLGFIFYFVFFIDSARKCIETFDK